jgi:molecular chaperone GrpE
VQDPTALLASLAAERDQLARERDEYYDLLLRRSAEFENYRRRVERERREMLELAGMETVRELLPILDDFERALQAETSDREYAKGIELIYQRLMETLKKIGLEPMSCQGEKFDPHQHEAIEMTPTEEVEDHTVIEQYRRGYNFRGRLLRPALVKVAVKPESNGRGQA